MEVTVKDQTENQTKVVRKSPQVKFIPEDGFLRRSEVLAFLRESPTGLRRKIKAGFYPDGHTLPGGRTRVWRACDIKLLITLISDGKTWQDRDRQAVNQ